MESGPRDRTKAGSSLRHWPPGTNSKTFVPSFFAPNPTSHHCACGTRLLLRVVVYPYPLPRPADLPRSPARLIFAIPDVRLSKREFDNKRRRWRRNCQFLQSSRSTSIVPLRMHQEHLQHYRRLWADLGVIRPGQSISVRAILRRQPHIAPTSIPRSSKIVWRALPNGHCQSPFYPRIRSLRHHRR
jgi:hypothetical protein